MQSAGRLRAVVRVPRWIFMCPAVALIASKAHGTPSSAVAAETARQAGVSARGAQVMPFELSATPTVFTKTAVGALQKVVVKDPGDAAQIQLIRRHLSDIAQRFARGDFSGPTEIHGEHMPGLADLKKAKPGEISVHYHDLVNGGETVHLTHQSKLVAAVKELLDGQVVDHGSSGHESPTKQL